MIDFNDKFNVNTVNLVNNEPPWDQFFCSE